MISTIGKYVQIGQHLILYVRWYPRMEKCTLDKVIRIYIFRVLVLQRHLHVIHPLILITTLSLF